MWFYRHQGNNDSIIEFLQLHFSYNLNTFRTNKTNFIQLAWKYHHEENGESHVGFKSTSRKIVLKQGDWLIVDKKFEEGFIIIHKN